MKAILFIGTKKSGSSREAILAAQNLGYYTVLFTNYKKQIEQRSEYPDVHLMKLCNLDHFEDMKSLIESLQARGIKFQAITTFVDSRCTIANKLAKEFRLTYFSIDAIEKMENKLLSRNTIKNTEYCPKYITIEKDNADEKAVKELLPAVLKSPKSSGSKDVYRIDDYNGFLNRYGDFCKKYPHQPILLEEYLDGPQVIAEVLVINGKIYIVGIIEQEISYLNYHYIVTGYSLVTEKPAYYSDFYKAVSNIIRLHGMKFGACHLEMRNVKGTWKLIEINPRISGGGMNQLIQFGTGINLVEQTLKLLLQEKIDIHPKFRKPVYAQYITAKEEGILEKVTGTTRTQSLTNILSVYIKPRKENNISLPISMGNRYAYVIATGENQEAARENAKNAIKEIQFHISKRENE